MNLKSLSLEELEARLQPHGGNPRAALKLFARVFAHGATELEMLLEMPQLPRGVRQALAAQASLPRLRVVERRRADDGFVKYLFESPRGGRVEAVRIPLYQGEERAKYVVCVSSQVGCAQACDFCMTGKLGFQRNLETWEILDQVQQIRAEAELPVRGVVFMGMGEPLLNYTEVIRAARVLSHPAGMAISGKAITLSTVGVVPMIRKYVREGHPYRLAFSITSAIPEKRRALLPVERHHPLPSLIEAIAEYTRVRRERAMLAYVAISGLNTGREDAEALARAFKNIPIKLDLIDVTDPTGRYQPPSSDELARFRDELQILGAPIARRYSGGKEIGAACGTLAASQYGGSVLAV